MSFEYGNLVVITGRTYFDGADGNGGSDSFIGLIGEIRYKLCAGVRDGDDVYAVKIDGQDGFKYFIKENIERRVR